MTLDVYYDARGKDLDTEDGYAETAAGKQAESKGLTHFKVRRLVFKFANDNELAEAQQRLKDDGFRFIE